MFLFNFVFYINVDCVPATIDWICRRLEIRMHENEQ